MPGAARPDSRIPLAQAGARLRSLLLQALPISLQQRVKSMLSPLALPPFAALGRWAARKVHGNARSTEGHLLTRTAYIDEDQEWRLGQAYLGLLGLPVFLPCFLYVQSAHRDLGYYRRSRHVHVLGPWADLPLDLKIIIPLMAIAHLVFLASFARLILVRQGLGSREELGE
jgi:hypothetical protein